MMGAVSTITWRSIGLDLTLLILQTSTTNKSPTEQPLRLLPWRPMFLGRELFLLDSSPWTNQVDGASWYWRRHVYRKVKRKKRVKTFFAHRQYSLKLPKHSRNIFGQQSETASGGVWTKPHAVKTQRVGLQRRFGLTCTIESVWSEWMRGKFLAFSRNLLEDARRADLL